MTLFVIRKVRADENGWLLEAIWRKADGALNRFTGEAVSAAPGDILAALERGDTVEVWAHSHGGQMVANDVLVRVDTDQGVRLRVHPQSEDAVFKVEHF